jgi:PIN domain nuclease of toxin-antitoxin system
MRVLLGTHVLLRILVEPSRLDEETRETIETDAEEVLFSACCTATRSTVSLSRRR